MVDGNNRSDIFILDNKPVRDNKTLDYHAYIRFLKGRGLRVELIKDFRQREKIYTTSAKVFIFAYMLGNKDSSGVFPAIKDEDIDKDITEVFKDFPDGEITGIDIAEDLRLAERDETYYIHIISSLTQKSKPFFSELTWKEWIKKGTIDSYSTRDVDDFVAHLDALEKAVKDRR